MRELDPQAQFDRRPEDHPDTILIDAIVAFSSIEPYVVLRSCRPHWQMTPAEARAHALKLLEIAAAAEEDALLIRFFTQRIGVDYPKAASILQDFRTLREEQERIQAIPEKSRTTH